MGGIAAHQDGGLGIVTLDDPAGGNRLGPSSLAALLETVERLVEDAGVRAVLLRSSGEAFCHGMDLGALGAADAADRRAGIERAVEVYVRLLEGIHDAPKPIIAAVDGSVKAGGVGLVSACDVVVASEESTFELGEVFFGIIPANVLPFLLGQRISLQKARYLTMTARSLGGRDAFAAGLVDEVYPRDRLEAGVRELLRRLWRTSPAAVAEAKSFTRELLGLDMEAAKSRAKLKLVELLDREEVIGAIRSFNEGGLPPWFGRWKASAPVLRRQGSSGGEA